MSRKVGVNKTLEFLESIEKNIPNGLFFTCSVKVHCLEMFAVLYRAVAVLEIMVSIQTFSDHFGILSNQKGLDQTFG